MKFFVLYFEVRNILKYILCIHRYKVLKIVVTQFMLSYDKCSSELNK